MYYTGIDPLTGEEVYVPKSFQERKMQRALLQYWMPENAETVRKALEELNRTDLIGDSSRCLVSEKRRSIRKVKCPMDKI